MKLIRIIKRIISESPDNQRYFFIFLFLIYTAQFFAQTTVEVTGTVKSQDGEDLPGAVIRLQQGNEKVVQVVADGNGLFRVNVKQGSYQLEVTYVGFIPFQANVDARKNTHLPILLKADSKELGQVVVKGRFVTYDTKGYRANIQAIPMLKGQPLDDVLRFMPGISITNNQISAYHENIIAVYVNGKRLRVNGDDLLQLLHTYNSQNIKNIELQNSTVEANASGSGYVLRINTLNPQDGGSATVALQTNASNQTGIYFMPNANLIEQTGKWSVFGSVNVTPYMKRESDHEQITDFITTGIQRVSKEEQTLKLNPTVRGNFTVSYDFSRKSSLTLGTNITTHNTTNHIDATNQITGAEGIGIQEEKSSVNKFAQRRHIDLIADYRLTLKKATYNAVASYTKNNNDITNNRTIFGNSVEENNQTDIQRDSHDQLLSLMTSGKWNLTKEHILSLALTYNKWDNNIDNWHAEHKKYDYQEDTYIANVAYNFVHSPIDIQVGTSIRHTHMKLKSMTNRKYNELLPYLVFSFLKNPMKGERLQLSYRHEIDYPMLGNLIPEMQWSSEYTYQLGNMDLDPTRLHIVNMVASLHQLTLTGTFTHSKGSVRMPFQDGTATGITEENGLRTNRLLVSAQYPLQIAKTWTVQLSGDIQIVGERLQKEKFDDTAWRAGVNIMGMLPWNIRLMNNASLTLPMNSMYVHENHGVFTDILTLSKSFMKNKLTTRLAFFYIGKREQITENAAFRITQRDQQSHFRTALTLSYNFKWGNKRVVNRHRLNDNMEWKRMDE